MLDWSAETEEEEQDLQWDLTGDIDWYAYISCMLCRDLLSVVEAIPGAIVIFCPVYILSCVLCHRYILVKVGLQTRVDTELQQTQQRPSGRTSLIYMMPALRHTDDTRR